MKAVFSVIKFILILALLVGLIGVAMYFSGYTMYAKIGENTIFESGSGYTVSSVEPLKVDLGYTFDYGGEKDMSGYSVMVVPNAIAGKDFTYKVGDNEYSYQATKDLTKGFDIECEETSFTIKSKGCLGVILSEIHKEELTTNGGGITHNHKNDYDNMYSLVVYSNDGESSVKIHFSNQEDNHGSIEDSENNGNTDNDEYIDGGQKPTNIYVDTAGYNTNSSGKIYLDPNKTYSFPIIAESVDGKIYNEDASYGVYTNSYGTVKLGHCEFSLVGGYLWSHTFSQDYSPFIWDLISVDVEGNNLVITTKDPIEDYYMTESQSGTTTKYTGKFHSYETECYIRVTVSDTENNLDTVVYFTITPKGGILEL